VYGNAAPPPDEGAHDALTAYDDEVAIKALSAIVE
jgi:hypothetical protein